MHLALASRTMRNYAALTTREIGPVSAYDTTRRNGFRTLSYVLVVVVVRVAICGLVDINDGLVGALAVRIVRAVTPGLVDISNGLVDIFIAHREYGFRCYTENFRRMRSFQRNPLIHRSADVLFLKHGNSNCAAVTPVVHLPVKRSRLELKISVLNTESCCYEVVIVNVIAEEFAQQAMVPTSPTGELASPTDVHVSRFAVHSIQTKICLAFPRVDHDTNQRFVRESNWADCFARHAERFDVNRLSIFPSDYQGIFITTSLDTTQTHFAGD